MKLQKNILILLILTVLVLVPLVSFGQTGTEQGYVPLAPLPSIAPSPSNNLSYYLTNAFYLGIAIAGVLAVIMIMLGGVQYMSTDAISGKEEGKERITKALLGLVLAIAAWLILNTINPQLLSTNININPLPAPEEGDGREYGAHMTKYKYLQEEDRCLLDLKIDEGVFAGPFPTEEGCVEFVRARNRLLNSYPLDATPPQCESWICVPL